VRIEQVQVDVDQLIKGMYVCALDRPWLSTPFPFQGFVIRSQKEITALKKYCNYVYVDVLRGVPPQADGALKKSWRANGTKVLDEDDDETSTKKANQQFVQSVVSAWSKEPRPKPTNIKSVALKIDHQAYSAPKKLDRELKKANTIHSELSQSVSQMIDDVRVGRGLESGSLRRATEKMVDSMIRHPDALVWLGKLRDKDGYSYAHSVRSSIMAVALGRQMGLSEIQMRRVAMGSLLCEIGKARLPRHLLEKKGELSEDDIERLQSHVLSGVHLLGSSTHMHDDVLEIVKCHHERFDGSGYPDGLAGDQIPILGRIAGMVDCYDAMTSHRPYTDKVYTSTEAMDYLYQERNILFQDQLVEEFIQAVGIYPTGTLVELNTGEIALIIAQNPENRIQPVVLLILDQLKHPYPKAQKVDLKAYNNKTDQRPVSIKRALVSGEFGLNANEMMEKHAVSRFDWRTLSFT